MSYEPTSAQSNNGSTKIVYVLLALIALVMLYRYTVSDDKSSAQTPKPVNLKATRWQAPNNGAGVQFANDNAKSKVVNYDPNNPFMGNIKNGIMIDGTTTF